MTQERNYSSSKAILLIIVTSAVVAALFFNKVFLILAAWITIAEFGRHKIYNKALQDVRPEFKSFVKDFPDAYTDLVEELKRRRLSGFQKRIFEQLIKEYYNVTVKL